MQIKLINRTLVFFGLLLLVACQSEEPPVFDAYLPYVKPEHFEWADSVARTLTTEQKVGQLILWQSGPLDSLQRQDAGYQLTNGIAGGIIPGAMSLVDYLFFLEEIYTQSPLTPFVGTTAPMLLNQQFRDVEAMPGLDILERIPNDSLRRHLQSLHFKQAQSLGINLQLRHSMNAAEQPLLQQQVEVANNQRMLSLVDDFSDYYPHYPDTARRFEILMKPTRQFMHAGTAGFVVSEAIGEEVEVAALRAYFEDRLAYRGLISARSSGTADPVRLLQAGVDLLLHEGHPAWLHRHLLQAVYEGQLSERQLDHAVRKVLMAKHWMYRGMTDRTEHPSPLHKPVQASIPAPAVVQTPKSIPSDLVYDHFMKADWASFRETIYRQTLQLVSDPKEVLPIGQPLAHKFRVITYGEGHFEAFRQQLAAYTSFRHQEGDVFNNGSLQIVARGEGRYTNLILFDDKQLHPDRDSLFLAKLRAAGENGTTILLSFGQTSGLAALDSVCVRLEAGPRNDYTERLAARLIMGGATSFSGIPVQQTRLGYTHPQEVGVAPEKLVGIDAIARQAIKDKATPGCQVLVAKDGQVIYHKAFGYHTYSKKRRVKTSDIYDLASLTKIMATGLTVMEQYERGNIGLNDRLKTLFPEFRKTPLKNIRVKELLTHRSGLHPGMPVVPYLLYRDKKNTACDSFFCRQQGGDYQLEVTDKFYFKKNYLDTIWADMPELDIRKNTKYRYSDANFVLLQKIVEKKSGTTLDKLATLQFYRPLGLQRTTFRPSKYFRKSEIIPTAKDERWRHQEIHGYVHDETAALLGGVAGHAGLFSRAEDLAVIMQMLLNGGTYGGHRFLEEKTVQLFTQAGHGNHRGLGFDKVHRTNASGRAYDMPAAAFGHTGFTGTCAWADPEEDLIFIFLSNRTYPNDRNARLFRKKVRTRIHQVVYDALGTVQSEWPELELPPSIS